MTTYERNEFFCDNAFLGNCLIHKIEYKIFKMCNK